MSGPSLPSLPSPPSPEFDADGFSVVEPRPRRRFRVLNDAPVGDGDNEDLLDSTGAARGLADLILASRASAPFTLAVDAPWGMGKSSLMRGIEQALRAEPDVESRWFNAWTAEHAGALEGLVKSVLLGFDRNAIRKAVRRVAEHRRLIGGLRIGLTLATGLFGLGRVVDDLWRQFSVDAKSRNEIRALVREIAETWMRGTSTSPGRLLVVFVDDLDRCSHSQIREVCEAIKLYLDVPGIVFVLGCDQDIVRRAVEERSAEAGYLDKIVQIDYRIAAPTMPLARALVTGYAERSGTAALLDEAMKTLLIERTKGNPRRIKRLLNTFVLEYHLHPEWDEVGVENLLKLTLLQHFHPEFHRVLVESGDPDPIGDFLIYQALRKTVRTGTTPPGVLRQARPLFASRDLQPPTEHHTREELVGLLGDLEKALPAAFVAEAADHTLDALLVGLADLSRSERMRELLRRRPISPLGTFSVETGEFDGMWVLWIDDRPENNEYLVEELRSRGARVITATGRTTALASLHRRTPTAIISDVGRVLLDGTVDRNAGLDDLEHFRRNGVYDGPVIFFTAMINPEREHRAAELGAQGITNSGGQVFDWLRQIWRGES